MNPQFRPLTRHEMFFGIAPKTNFSNGGVVKPIGMVSNVASIPINANYVSPTPAVSINTDVIAQQQIGFVLSDFLFKYRWEIGIFVAGIAVGAIIYCSTKEKEDKKY